MERLKHRELDSSRDTKKDIYRNRKNRKYEQREHKTEKREIKKTLKNIAGDIFITGTQKQSCSNLHFPLNINKS